MDEMQSYGYCVIEINDMVRGQTWTVWQGQKKKIGDKLSLQAAHDRDHHRARGTGEGIHQKTPRHCCMEGLLAVYQFTRVREQSSLEGPGRLQLQPSRRRESASLLRAYTQRDANRMRPDLQHPAFLGHAI